MGSGRGGGRRWIRQGGLFRRIRQPLDCLVAEQASGLAEELRLHVRENAVEVECDAERQGSLPMRELDRVELVEVELGPLVALECCFFEIRRIRRQRSGGCFAFCFVEPRTEVVHSADSVLGRLWLRQRVPSRQLVRSAE